MEMNKQLITSRFSKASTSYDKEATVQRQIAGRMISLMKDTIRIECESLLEIGCGTGIFSRLLLQHIKPQKMIMNDICMEMKKNLSDILDDHHTFICGDAELWSFPSQMDMIASCSTIQWFARPHSFFERCHTALKESGVLVFSTFGKDNLKEISSVTGAGLSYRSLHELKRDLLSLNYDILYAGEEIISKTFETPLRVLHHLKRTGVTGIQTQSWTKGTLNTYCGEYTSRYSNGNSVSLTYHPIYIIAKKK